VGLYHNINIGSDPQECLNDAATFFDKYYGVGAIPREVQRVLTATGPVSDCVDHLVDLVLQGANHIALRIVSLNQARHWKALVQDVLPAVRDRLATMA
jgi:hypothetical protein